MKINELQKILDISKTDTHLVVDTRVELPLTQISEEMVNDLLITDKDRYTKGWEINGEKFMFMVAVDLDVDSGNTILKFVPVRV